MQSAHLHFRGTLAGDQVALTQLRIKVRKSCCVHNLLLESNQPHLTALLKQPGKRLLCHRAFTMNTSVEVPTRTAMYFDAGRNIQADQRLLLTTVILSLEDDRHESGRALDAVIDDSIKPLLNGRQTSTGYAEDAASAIIHTQYENASIAAIGKGGNLIRQPIRTRIAGPIAIAAKHQLL